MTIAKVYFDDWELTKYFHVRSITSYLQSSRNNVFQTHPDRDGAQFKKSTLGQAVVEMKVSIRSNTLETMDTLNRMLNVREPKRLFIDDRPDRYLMAILDNGATAISGRYYASTMTLKFISPDSFWKSTYGPRQISFDSSGSAIVGVRGTADSPIEINMKFSDDCGHVAVVTPMGHVSLGNPEEVDSISVPSSEMAINDELTTMSAWTKMTRENVIDLIGEMDATSMLNPVENPKHDQWGLIVDQDWKNSTSGWNGVSYKRDFDEGLAGRLASNFKHKSRIDFEDLSGTTFNSIKSQYFIYDENDNLLMGMSIEDNGYTHNELVVYIWYSSMNSDGSLIVKKEKSNRIPRIRGWIAMEKMGNVFTWKVHSDVGAQAPAATTPPALKVGDIVKLKSTATIIYNWDGVALRLDQSILGDQLRVTAIRNSPKGKYQLTSVKHGWVEGFFELDAIQQASPPPPQATTPVPAGFTVTKTMSDLAQKSAKGFSVGLYKFGAVKGYSTASINNITVQRIHTQNSYDIKNTFMAGDVLSIKGSEILLNGSVFDGQISYDSRPLYIEGGFDSQVSILTSSWAQKPSATLTYEDRWL